MIGLKDSLTLITTLTLIRSATSIKPLEVPISSSGGGGWSCWGRVWGLRNEDLKRGLLLVYANLVQLNCIIMRHIFIHANETCFHRKGSALGLNLKVGGFGTRKWPIILIAEDINCKIP